MSNTSKRTYPGGPHGAAYPRFYRILSRWSIFTIIFAGQVSADNVDGAWSTVEDWPLIAIHSALTPDGRVLTYGTDGSGKQTGYFIYDIWDPAAGLGSGHLTLNNMTLTDIFCSSQIILPQSAEILIAGGDNWTGNNTTNTGNNNSNIFDPFENTLARSANMQRARWYSSSTVLVNGEIYIQGGNGGADFPEIRELDGSFRLLTGVSTSGYRTLFPRNFLAQDGRIFGYDTQGKMYFVSTDGTGSKSDVGQFSSSNAGWTSSTAMFRPGMILQFGGNSNGALVIDINGPQPVVTPTQSMATKRSWVNATIMADGKVVGTGGSEVDNQLTGVSNVAEIWDPATGQWHSGAAGALARLYHSTGLLLPDGSVLVAGGGAPGPLNNTNAEIYYPPYLFDANGDFADRPQIISAPDTVNVGDTMTVQVDSTASRVTFVKTGSVTHSFNMDQRFIELPFTDASNTLFVELPERSSDTPPGFYQMFVFNDAGVPSEARMVRVNIDSTPNLQVNYTPTIGGSGGSPFTLACALDETLVGVHGNFSTYVNQVGPQCVKIDQLGRWIGDPVDGPVTGSTTTGTTFSKTCPRDHAVSGFQGNSASYVDQIDIQCRALTPAGGLTGTSQYLGSDGGPGGSPQGPFSCGTNNPVYALYGRSGGWIDAFGMQCRQAPITPISINSSPVIVNPGNQSGVAGVAADLQIGASDGDNDPLNFSAAGLPGGLQIDAATGRITGVPLIANLYTVNVSVTDGTDSDSTSFDWDIAAAPPLSVDTMPPQPPVVVGSPVTYNAVANGGTNVMYQWDFGDDTAIEPLSSDPDVTHLFAQPGIYFVTLTVVDDAGQPDIQTFVQTVYRAPTENAARHSTNIAYESPAAGDDRIWVVNQDNDSVSVVDSISNSRIAEIAVGNDPRALAVAPDGRIWVVNKASANLSIVDPVDLAVTQTVSLPFASQPYGLVFSPTANEAYIALEGTGTVLKLNATTGAQLGALAVGENIRHLAVSGDGATVYVSRFVTPPQPGEHTATIAGEVGGIKFGGEVIVVDSANMSLQSTLILEHSQEVDAENQGGGVPNYLGAVAISPDGVGAYVPSKMDNIGRGLLRSGANLNFQNTVRAIASYVDIASGAEDYSRRIDLDDSSIATSVIFDQYGIYAFVALETSREVAIIDFHGGYELFRIDTGRAPQGLALSDDGNTLYVNNFMDRTIGVYDLTELQSVGQWNVPLVTNITSVSAEALTPEVLLGKQLFYDARDTRLARDRYLSCASCHNDGGHDGRVWDLTGFGEGLRNTIGLRGTAASHGPLHWSENFDEVQDFEGQIRDLSGGTGLMDDADFNVGTRNEPLGLPKAGISADLDALAAYVESLDEFAPSPHRNADGTMSSDAAAGAAIFARENCAACHAGDAYTDSAPGNLHDIGTVLPSSGSRLGQTLTGIDTPTLIGVWKSAPYLHDGSRGTIADAITAHNGVSLSAGDLAQLSAYLKELDEETSGNTSCLGCVDFGVETLLPVPNQGDGGVMTILDDGATIRLEQDAWRISTGGYDITPDTVLEFTFESTFEGDYHGIGFDEDDVISRNRIFVVYGNRHKNFTIKDFDTYTGPGPENFRIPVGQYYTGTGMRLVLINNDDNGVGGNSTFSNVRVYEDVVPPTPLPPSLSDPGNQSDFIDVALSLDIDATDPNGDPLSYAADVLPTGLTINSVTGEISGTPTAIGTWTVTVSVDDGNGGTDSATFDWTIDVPPQLPPVMDNPGDQSNRVDTPVSLTVTATDPNGDIMTFSASGLPTGLVIDSVSGEISGTPTVLGTYDVTVSVDDGFSGSDSASFVWQIVDGSVCTECIDFAVESMAPVPNQGNGGVMTILDDGATIRLEQDAWRISTGGYDITPDTVLEFTFESTFEGDYHGIGFDEDDVIGRNRIFVVYGNRHKNFTIKDFDTYTGPGPENFRIPVGQYYTGTGMRLVLINNDDDGVGGNSTFRNVRIYEDLVPPTPLPPSVTDPGDQSNFVNVALSLDIDATDPNGDPLSYAADVLPTGLSINPVTGEISGTPTAIGTWAVTVTVDDGNGGTDSATFDWTIDAPPLLPPVIDNPGAQSDRIDTPLSLTVTATDPNGDIMTFSASGLPTGLAIDTVSGEISGTPTVLGIYNVTVSVDDGFSGSDSASFVWQIVDGSVCTDCVDFSGNPTTSFSGQDVDGLVTILDGGFTIRLDNNTWRITDQVFDITPETMLEFTFESSAEAEYHAIGFEEDQIISRNRAFAIHGNAHRNFTIKDFDNYAEAGPQSFLIPVGQYYTGTGMRLVLINNDDGGGVSNGTFRNIRVFVP